MTPSELLCDLASCLCAELDDGEELCFCGVLPGELVLADLAGYECGQACGMAWVRMASAYPSTIIGEADTTQMNCDKMLGLDIEIGVYRCVADLDDPTVVPEPARLIEVSDLAIEDMLAMRRAVHCCSALADQGYSLGLYVPLGPVGGIAGGTWTVFTSI